MHGFLEVFWAIILSLFGALVMGGLMVGGALLVIGGTLFGLTWLVLSRRRRKSASRKRD